jgi:predicted ATPase/class 3 adenylate cyclase
LDVHRDFCEVAVSEGGKARSVGRVAARPQQLQPRLGIPPATRNPLSVRDLPAGTVTFLFTDVEGSTRLLHELGPEGYSEALANHRLVLRRAFARHGGVEVDTQGDALFAAFPTAPGALKAAREACKALELGPIRVRIGVHTGTPLVTDEGYVGADVHRAARIAAAGHGGQVLVSSTAAALADAHELRDLGRHRFKDLAAPERVYQLGGAEFPPLKTLYRMELPVPVTPLIGRERELGEAIALLHECHLLTLTGAGGIGKTRLALHVAAEVAGEFADGVYWVPLAGVQDPALVLPSLAQAVASRNGLEEHLSDKEMLIVVDNFEQVIDASPLVGGLLMRCPNVRLLVTSRVLLNIAAEHEYTVRPLSDADAVALFSVRAPRAGSAETAAEICRRLDRLPLAIELAAARTRTVAPDTLLARLEHALPILTSAARDLPDRQRTLRATIQWSYDLLPRKAQALFTRLGVFAGNFTLEAAEDVAGADIDSLETLVEASVIHVEGDRYGMLETVREFALTCHAATGDMRERRRRHAEYFLAMAVHAERHLRGPKQVEWLRDLEQEIENIRATLTWALEEGECELALTLASALERFWPAHGRAVEALTWFDSLLDRCGAEAQAATRARALWVAGRQASQLHLNARAEALFEQAEPLLRRIGEGEALVFCLGELAQIQGRKGNAKEATRLAEEALATARQLGGPRPLSAALETLASDAEMQNDHVRALALREESLALRRGLEDPTVVVSSLYSIGLSALALGDEERARAAFAECLQLARELGHLILIAASAANLGYLELFRGNVDDARSLLHDGLKLFSDTGDEAYAADCVSGVAAVAAAEGRPLIAVRLWEAVDAFLAQTGEELDEIDASARNRFEAAARTALDPVEREKAAQEGTRTPLNEAIGLALEVSDTP